VPGSNPLTVAPLDAVAQGAWGTSGNGPTNPQELNRYSYGLNNPIRNTDPTGHCAEVVSCTIVGGTAGTFVCGPLCGVAGAAGAAIVSAAIIYGGYVLATSTPGDGAPSSVGGVEGLPTGVETSDATSNLEDTDFVVTPDGVAVPVSQQQMKDGFEQAGFPSQAAVKTEPGTVYTVPTKNGPVDVRAMEGSPNHPRRTVVSTPGTNSPRTPSGRTPQGTQQQRRDASHYQQRE